MSFGKMRTEIDLLRLETTIDKDGFATNTEAVLCRVPAYMEERHGNEQWANRAAFSKATALFRFRRIPGLTVDTSQYIRTGGTLYRIHSAENVRGRGMYVEVLAEKLEPTKR